MRLNKSGLSAIGMVGSLLFLVIIVLIGIQIANNINDKGNLLNDLGATDDFDRDGMVNSLDPCDFGSDVPDPVNINGEQNICIFYRSTEDDCKIILSQIENSATEQNIKVNVNIKFMQDGNRNYCYYKSG